MLVRAAYRYPPTDDFRAEPGSQFVAVDAEFRSFGDSLDLDDVEILDPATGQNLGGAYEAPFLSSDGTFASWHEAPPGGPLRVLLLFHVPASLDRLQLFHWGDVLTPSPIRIAPTGPTLPKFKRGV